MMNEKRFNSIEEVKEFISDAENVSSSVISFVDESGKSTKMSMKDFIETVGLDEAAKFFYEKTGHMMSFEMSDKDMDTLFKKLADDPNSLTEEEKMILLLAIEKIKNKVNDFATPMEITAIMIKTIVELGKGFGQDINTFLGLMLTFMQSVVVTNSDLNNIVVDNEVAFKEICRKAKEQIIIPEDIDDATLLVGLISTIGDRFIGSKFGETKINYYETAQSLGLDTGFIFNEDDKFNEELSSEPSSNSEKPLEDNPKIVDIRNVLKNNRV